MLTNLFSVASCKISGYCKINNCLYNGGHCMFWLLVTLPESRNSGCMVNTKGPHGMLSWNISIQGNSVARCVCVRACVLFHHCGAPKGHQNCLFHTLSVNLDTVIGNTCSTSSKSFCTLLHLNEPNMVCLHKIFKLSKHDVCVAYKLKSPVGCLGEISLFFEPEIRTKLSQDCGPSALRLLQPEGTCISN